MKNKIDLHDSTIVCQLFVALVAAVNIVITAITKANSVSSHLCCLILIIVQAIQIIVMRTMESDV